LIIYVKWTFFILLMELSYVVFLLITRLTWSNPTINKLFIQQWHKNKVAIAIFSLEDKG